MTWVAALAGPYIVACVLLVLRRARLTGTCPVTVLGRARLVAPGALLVLLALLAGLLFRPVAPALALMAAAGIIAVFRPAAAWRLLPLLLIGLGLYGLDVLRQISRKFLGIYFDLPQGVHRFYGLADIGTSNNVHLVLLQMWAFLLTGGLLAWRATASSSSHLAGRVLWVRPDGTSGGRRPRTRALFWPAAAGLQDRVERLTRTRAEAVDTAAAELRRVERDLHDGAQARLVALGMSLRAAERLFTSSPQAALELIAEARQSSSKALTELRDLVRGIYPPVLADRGLADAVRALALDTPLRTEVDVDLPGRPDAPVESACYFSVAEALANAVKHGGASQVQVRMRYVRGMLRIEVTDDGAGGADPAKGSGLRGLERRLAAFDGILAVSSPPGGPTLIVIEVPCALS